MDRIIQSFKFSAIILGWSKGNEELSPLITVNALAVDGKTERNMCKCVVHKYICLIMNKCWGKKA